MKNKSSQKTYLINPCRIVCFAGVFSLLISCNGSEPSSLPLAQMGDNFIGIEEALEAMPEGLSGKDSIAFLQNLADAWVRRQVVLQKAQENINPEDFDIDQRAEEYRQSLITYHYEQKWVQQNLDTLVSQKEIEKYYKEHPGDFELKDNIIKVRYVKVRKDIPKLEQFKKLYQSDAEKDRQLLADLCQQQAENFFLNDDTWLLFDDLLKEIPIKTYDQENYLENNRNIEFTDGPYLYLVHIKGFKIKEGQSPISFERENIKQIILNQRKVFLVEQLRNNLYQKAVRDKDFEIYLKESAEK